MIKATKITSRPAKSIYRPENQAVIGVLRSLRERTGLNQTQFAEVLGRNQTYVSSAERGAKLDTLQIRDWCLACGTDLLGWAVEVEKALKSARKLVVALLFFLAGCTANVGTPYDASAVDHFIPMKTSMDQVIATMGRPQDSSVARDGTTRLLYFYFTPNDDGVKPQSQGTYLYFDNDGKYMRAETSRLDRRCRHAARGPADGSACPIWFSEVIQRLSTA